MMLAALVCLIAVPLWLGVIANLLTLNDSDAAGNALSQAFGAIGLIIVWILLAVLLVVAAVKGSMPGWVKPVAVVLLPASGAAALAVLDLLGHREPVKWMIVVPVVVPLLVFTFSAWALLPGFHSAFSGKVAGGVAWSVILLLSIVPWLRVAQMPEIRKQRAAARQAMADSLDALTPATPVAEWLKFTQSGIDADLRERALQGVRGLSHKQTDVEQMLATGDDRPLPVLRELELEPPSGFVKFRENALAFEPPPCGCRTGTRSSATSRWRWTPTNRRSCGWRGIIVRWSPN